MKRVEVSALRERGLHRAGGAEPQADGDTIGRHHLNNRESPINSMERKADTVKTYILRDPDVVEIDDTLPRQAVRRHQPHFRWTVPNRRRDLSNRDLGKKCQRRRPS